MQNKEKFSYVQAENGFKEHIKIMELAKKPYFEQFDLVYEKVVVQAKAQEEVLGLYGEPGEKAVGCTPVDLSDGIRKKKIISIPTQVLALEKIKKEAEDNLKECNKNRSYNLTLHAHGCEYYKTRKEVLEKRIQSMKEGEVNCLLVKEVLATSETKRKIAGVLQNAHLFIDKYNIITSVSQVEQLVSNIANNGTPKSGACYNGMLAYKRLNELYEKELLPLEAGSENITDEEAPKQCGENDKFCKDFTAKNAQLLHKSEQLYDPKISDCVTYAEYSTYKGMPSQALLRQLARAKNPAELLTNHTTNKDAKEFIKANPLIAVVARGSDASALGDKLKALAKKMLASKETGNTANFKGYLDFMTGDDGFKELYKHDKKSSNKAVCEELQRNYAAIELSDDSPQIKNEAYKDPLDKTTQVVRECIGRVYENTGSTDLDGTLKISPIYDLGEVKETDEPSVDGFTEFKKVHCAGYDKHVEANCKDGDLSKCRASFKSTSEISERRDHMTRVGVITGGFNKVSLDRMASHTDPLQQDVAYNNWWQKNVGDKMSQEASMTYNDNGRFASDMKRTQSISGSPDIQSRYEDYQRSQNPNFTPSSNGIANINQTTPSTDNSSVTDGDKFTRSNNDENQVRPNFTNQNTNPPITNFNNVSSDVIKSATDMTQIDPDFNSRSNQDKLTSYNALKDFVKDGGTAPAFNPADEIQKIEEKVVTKTEPLKDVPGINPRPTERDNTFVKTPASRAPSSIGQATSFNPPISNAAVLGQFPRASVSVKPDKMTAAQKSYQDALLKMGTGHIIIQESDAVGPYEVSKRNIITADNEDGVYPFSELSKPDRLSEFLASRLGNSVNNGESVMIKKPGTNDYFVVKATKNDGVTSYQLIPFVKKEDIKLYSNLKNLFRR